MNQATIASTPPASQIPTEGLERKLRFHYLDGLRGLAALYVVLHHAVMEVAGVKNWLSAGALRPTLWFSNGQIAVEVFIVLSGYCLMLPIARSGELKGGRWGFIKRRARRILPPYYAALAFSLLCILLVPGMGVASGIRWDMSLPAFRADVLWSHLLLLQDLKHEWLNKINYPMWSIAQEWQIYFVFVLMLLPLWRRLGIIPVVMITFLVSAFLRRAWGHHFEFACPGFLFLFSVGMLGADLGFARQSEASRRIVKTVPWTLLALLLWSAYMALTVYFSSSLDRFYSTSFGLLSAAASFTLIVACTNLVKAGKMHPLLRVLESAPVVALGVFSYSLYLTHAPVLAGFTLLLRGAHVSGGASLLIQLFVAVPTAVILAYGFHRVAERPFMSLPQNLPMVANICRRSLAR